MNTPTTFTIMFKHAAAKGPTFTTPQATAAALEDEYGKITMYDLLLHYKDGPSERVDAQLWLDDYRTARIVRDGQEDADRALLAEKQNRLAEALKKYNAGYDNELYIRACYSLPARTQGEWSYVNACVSLSDAALAVCGGQQYGSLTFDELTPAVIRFLAAFVTPLADEMELPF